MAHLIVLAAELYAAIGAAVAAWFLLLRLDRIDPAAYGAYAFRPLLIPGIVSLWPLVLLRYNRSPAAAPRDLRRTHWRIWLVLSALLPLLLIGALALRQNGPSEAAPGAAGATMTARYVPVGWNQTKLVYDAVLVVAVALYILLYIRLIPVLQPFILPPDPPTTAMDAYGSCAFLLLTAVLCIGPLARLDRRFAPLLYNRRHFGVLTAAVATGHAWQAINWYFAYGKLPIAEALLVLDSSYFQFHGFPFVPFGIAALAILLALAFTSHDFWLTFLTPPVWKSLHMAVYAAYALIMLHIALGVLQGSSNPLFAMVVAASVTLVCTLHLTAGNRQRRLDAAAARAAAGWIDAAAISEIADGAGIIVNPPGVDAVAIFRNGNAFSAVSNRCAHQNGPLGEGRIIDGCVTCPWHGYQYRLEDGCAPPPYTDKLATYRLRLAGDRILLDPRPNAPGTRIEPVRIAEAKP